MKRLVLMVEGAGDEQAAPSLVQRVLERLDAEGDLFIDGHPLKNLSLPKLTKNEFQQWQRVLTYAARRPQTSGVMLLLDGDAERFQDRAFCAAEAARELASHASDIVNRSGVYVAVVFACREFESWLIAGIDTLGGVELCDARGVIPDNLQPPAGELEQSPRDAKGWLKTNLPGYRQTLDQATLIGNVDLDVLTERMRSYRRLEQAIRDIVDAVRRERPCLSPVDSDTDRST